MSKVTEPLPAEEIVILSDILPTTETPAIFIPPARVMLEPVIVEPLIVVNCAVVPETVDPTNEPVTDTPSFVADKTVLPLVTKSI